MGYRLAILTKVFRLLYVRCANDFVAPETMLLIQVSSSDSCASALHRSTSDAVRPGGNDLEPLLSVRSRRRCL
jgi:hypothetical protein